MDKTLHFVFDSEDGREFIYDHIPRKCISPTLRLLRHNVPFRSDYFKILSRLIGVCARACQPNHLPMIHSEYVRHDSGFAYAIFRSTNISPPRVIGRPGDLFVREEDNQLFYRMPENTHYLRKSKKYHTFPPRWRPVYPGVDVKYLHPEHPLYHLVGKFTEPAWVGLSKADECPLDFAIAMYCRLKKKTDTSRSPEL